MKIFFCNFPTRSKFEFLYKRNNRTVNFDRMPKADNQTFSLFFILLLQYGVCRVKIKWKPLKQSQALILCKTKNSVKVYEKSNFSRN